jgi:hypothetical protein
LTREEGVEGWMVGEGLVGNPRSISTQSCLDPPSSKLSFPREL